MNESFSPLPYDPSRFPRELKKHYISATETEIQQMFEQIDTPDREGLFAHIPSSLLFDSPPDLPRGLDYTTLWKHMVNLSKQNNPSLSFIGDGLGHYKVPPLIPFISSIRGLTTAYTPYQPERSQGTLNGLWPYTCSLSMLTGFEAVNASLYDRASAVYEAILTAGRLRKGRHRVLLAASLYPGDLEVVQTLTRYTNIQLELIPLDSHTGTISQKALKETLKNDKRETACVVFPQVNSFGNLEEVDILCDLTHDVDALAVAVIDPIELSTGGLKPPCDFGEKGADIFVGEGQHLAIAPNFGGPGLGLFGIRHNSKCKNHIRSAPGRFVGKTTDREGNTALAMILSTREQHIRREKATSNICSNQSFLATLVGAGILCRGEEGMTKTRETSWNNAREAVSQLTSLTGVDLAFPRTPCCHEVTFQVSIPPGELIEQAGKSGIHLGVDVSQRGGRENLLLVSFFDIHGHKEIKRLIDFFQSRFKKGKSTNTFVQIPDRFLRSSPVNLPQIPLEELKKFYTQLGEQNISPDNNIYPLGSCTMKYNPHINDHAANLQGFTDLHPQAPSKDCQGNLRLLFEIQEIFKKITGLCGVTTQPVAGAQGELVGLKMFQAYHHDKGEKRNIILIPMSAHGTNPASAAIVGYDIVFIHANEKGQIDWPNLKLQVHQHKDKIAGIMVTNPNTAGIFEEDFKKVSQLIHEAGGLVYMDGANMNAIAGWIDLKAMGVDAVHNNLHKTWSIPHGGGGPGDAIVAVSSLLKDYLPGLQIKKEDNLYVSFSAKKSIGSVHRHFGNFAHKVRCYTYLKALGGEGIRRMSAMAVLSSRYLHHKSRELFVSLPNKADDVPRMHEFILSIDQDTFLKTIPLNIPKPQVIAQIGKLFLDFGLHAPTVSFPEALGLMIEPTESFSKKELDRFIEILKGIHYLIKNHPKVLISTPHFTPVRKVDEVSANRKIQTWEMMESLPTVLPNKISPAEILQMPVNKIIDRIIQASQT